MPVDEESALLEALNQEIAVYQAAELLPAQRALADQDLALCSAALIAHTLQRHDRGAAAVRIDEDCDPDERFASAVVSAEGAERDLTDAESDDLGALACNLTDGNALAWRPLCGHVDDRRGVYYLQLDAARQAGRELLARRAAPSA
ncbi:hypothetical protein [Streptomyces ipomoeae]|uniref:hypothetical protein n=1 Tax=Streptomyces ipomoeae TaxID=103232 RepID=UPI0015F0B948|nr:hypothetical protein [Streptomyces ipomoeae]